MLKLQAFGCFGNKHNFTNNPATRTMQNFNYFWFKETLW